MAIVTPLVGCDLLVFNDRDEDLLVPRKDHGRWCLPSGCRKTGGTPREAAEREGREESGYAINTVRAEFLDLGALVAYLHAIPWQIPDFDVSRYRPALRKIYEEIGRQGRVRFQGHRFFLVARKPGLPRPGG